MIPIFWEIDKKGIEPFLRFILESHLDFIHLYN